MCESENWTIIWDGRVAKYVYINDTSSATPPLACRKGSLWFESHHFPF